MNQFRIGACYRQRNGRVVKVISEVPEQAFGSFPFFAGVGAVALMSEGWRRASDGLCVNLFGDRLEDADLMPGEVDERGNPISEQKAETVGEFVDFLEEAFPDKATDPNAAMLARDVAAMQHAKPQPQEPRKPASKPFPLTISPDLSYASHQVSPGFGSALLGMDRG